MWPQLGCIAHPEAPQRTLAVLQVSPLPQPPHAPLSHVLRGEGGSACARRGGRAALRPVARPRPQVFNKAHDAAFTERDHLAMRLLLEQAARPLENALAFDVMRKQDAVLSGMQARPGEAAARTHCCRALGPVRPAACALPLQAWRAPASSRGVPSVFSSVHGSLQELACTMLSASNQAELTETLATKGKKLLNAHRLMVTFLDIPMTLAASNVRRRRRRQGALRWGV